MSRTKKLIWAAAVVVAVLGVLTVLYQTAARRPVPVSALRIAIVDGQTVKTKAVPFVKVRELLEQEHTRIHTDILAKETQLREEHQRLKKAKAKPEEKLAFDKKVSALEQQVQKTKEKLSKQFALLTDQVETTFNQVIENLVQEKGLTVVFNLSIQEIRSVLYNDKALDITEVVIEKLNERLPKLYLPNID